MRVSAAREGRATLKLPWRELSTCGGLWWCGLFPRLARGSVRLIGAGHVGESVIWMVMGSFERKKHDSMLYVFQSRVSPCCAPEGGLSCLVKTAWENTDHGGRLIPRGNICLWGCSPYPTRCRPCRAQAGLAL